MKSLAWLRSYGLITWSFEVRAEHDNKEPLTNQDDHCKPYDRKCNLSQLSQAGKNACHLKLS